MSFLLRIRKIAFTGLLVVAPFASAQQVQEPVSGYEIYLGHNCKVAGQPATCGATFTGWTGVTSTGGWLAFPGTQQGVWTVQINYTGHPSFGQTAPAPQVTIAGGTWSFLFFSGMELKGRVVGGTVSWPYDTSSDIGCGDGVAVAEANLTLNGGKSASLAGCLHDIPAGTVIPPQEWGEFTFNF